MQALKLIGNSPLLVDYAYTCSFFNLNSIYAHSLRWRKPIWLPTAKSKVFRVPKRPKLPEDEAKEIQRLYNNYRTTYRSLRKYLHKVNVENKIELDQSVIDKAEEDDFNECFKINEEWNRKVAAEREIRLKEEAEARKKQIFESIAKKKERDAQILSMVDEKIKETKLLAPTFITRSNIDQAIEEALSDIVDHNKAITVGGEWYTQMPVKKLDSSAVQSDP